MNDVACMPYLDDNGMYSTMMIPRGEINEDVIRVYKSGQCLAFAQAMAELTDMPVVWAFSSTQGNHSPEWAAEWDGRTVAEWRAHHQSKTGTPGNWALGFIHAMVEAPNGYLVDISSCGTPQKWHDYWNDYGLGPIAFLKASAEDMENLQYESTKAVAPQVIELAHGYAEIRERNAKRAAQDAR
ncbi:hypothetical protein [Shimazuella alba]|uniref:Uncharacterized protein n=1 Tax=Shimazuella alba TaxID=2690964 RepID=A0A6I4VNY3_9BACL|nr:hypothetical protein [Shimazuella alba]MXQ52773.1 hypothetical protein [Shimazuella alba]